MEYLHLRVSSSGSTSGTDDDDTDADEPLHRGRPDSHIRQGNVLHHNSERVDHSSSQRPSVSQNVPSLGDSVNPANVNGRTSFTRSRSPAVVRPSIMVSSSLAQCAPSPSGSSRHRPPSVYRSLLPAAIQFHFRVPLTRVLLTLYADTRKCGECFLLSASLLFVIFKLSGTALGESVPDVSMTATPGQILPPTLPPISPLIIEISILVLVSLLYIIWTHTSYQILPAISSRPGSPATLQHQQHLMPLHPPEVRESRRSGTPTQVGNKTFHGYIWMSVPKNYRESLDDGLSTGLFFGPLIASAVLYSSMQQLHKVVSGHPSDILPASWRIEPPAHLMNPHSPSTVLEALILSRYNLLELATFCSTLLLIHVFTSRWFEYQCRKSVSEQTNERYSVPRSEARRSWYYVSLTVVVSMGMVIWRALSEELGLGVWHYMSYFEVLTCSLFYQFTLYVALRLAHRCLTLGELGIVCFGGTALGTELLNLTTARIWTVTTPFIKTYRLPTPLLVFQMALIAGSFFTGFLLSPLLVLSRHIAQRPVRKLRFPQEKQRHRRGLAACFYIGAVLIVGGLIGMWTRWCLGKRDPWLWAIFYILEGRRKWSRPMLLAYWLLLVSISVAAWNRQLARFRRYPHRDSLNGLNGLGTFENGNGQASEPISSNPSTSGTLGLTFPNLPNVTNGATDLLDAADKHVPTLTLNARRKFFHALAVIMFVPGVAFDPAFTHLSFSVAFALFIFAEYVRYFAIYPFSAAVHVFMNDFLDHKDNGTVILSHFYLLTGIAGSVWLEGQSMLLQFTGILALGVGDALASIIGKRIGTHRWSPTTSKTLEGSGAFALSVITCAWILRLLGLVEPFSTTRYTVIVGLSSLLEALSVQNDNLTLPLYMWSMLAAADV